MSQSNLIHKQFLYFKGEVALPLFKTLPKVRTIFLKMDVIGLISASFFAGITRILNYRTK